MITPPFKRTATVSSAMAVALLTTMATSMVGCESQQRGRVDVYETTEAETYSDQVLPVALTEFSDQVPESLVADLAMIPEITDAPGPATIILGDLNNQTRIVPTGDFELMAQRIRNQLINSKYARSQMRFVELRRRVERIAEQERVTTDAASGTFDTGDYPAETTFFLLGDFHRIGRGDVNQYYMQFQLVHAGSNAIVFSDRYDVKQVN